jgi:hypothetical protein
LCPQEGSGYSILLAIFSSLLFLIQSKIIIIINLLMQSNLRIQLFPKISL